MPRFNPLDHPCLFEVPELVNPTCAWLEHVPFAFLLMELTRPATLVELGTHAGDSYCAFCQAIAAMKLSTRCTAIDTWTGDPHAGFYSVDLLTSLRQYHDPRYASFSTLLQGTFDQHRSQFPDESIDVLHIDGMHTYEAVKHDFETWLSAMSSSGVMLFHDTQVDAKDFGVRRLFAEVAIGRPSFEFPHCNGLGVLVVGDSPPPKLMEFFEAAGADSEMVLRCFARLGREVTLRGVMGANYMLQRGIAQMNRSAGLQVNPMLDRQGVALNQPIVYMQHAIQNTEALALQLLRLRESLGQASPANLTGESPPGTDRTP